MQKLPEAPDRKRGSACTKEPSQQKKEACALSTVTSRVTTPKSFLLVEGAMHPSLDDVLANLSTSSSCLFYQQPTTKNTK